MISKIFLGISGLWIAIIVLVVLWCIICGASPYASVEWHIDAFAFTLVTIAAIARILWEYC